MLRSVSLNPRPPCFCPLLALDQLAKTDLSPMLCFCRFSIEHVDSVSCLYSNRVDKVTRKPKTYMVSPILQEYFALRINSLSRTSVQPIYGSSPLFAIMEAAVFGDKDRIRLAYVNQDYYY